MVTARLHDGAAIEVTVLGDGPAVLLPVNPAIQEGEAAEALRAWGMDPNLGHTLLTSLAAAGYRAIAADYEQHLTDHPKPATLTADAVVHDMLAMADAAAADRFAYYGYSWLAVVGLQLAIRSDRLTALAMGGYPPLDGPYDVMLAVTRTAHRMALAGQDRPPVEVSPEPGDWDSAEVTRTPDQTQQYVTLYESLEGFRDETVELTGPRLAFAGEHDEIAYGPKWDNAVVRLAEPLRRHRDELVRRGWTVELIAGKDHMSAMQADVVLPILLPWLGQAATRLNVQTA